MFYKASINNKHRAFGTSVESNILFYMDFKRGANHARVLHKFEYVNLLMNIAGAIRFHYVFQCVALTFGFIERLKVTREHKKKQKQISIRVYNLSIYNRDFLLRFTI